MIPPTVERIGLQLQHLSGMRILFVRECRWYHLLSIWPSVERVGLLMRHFNGMYRLFVSGSR